jgi:predicted metalloprotease with PDZ domain
MTVSDAPTGNFRVHMSRSSPGRYATHEFGKNVYNVKATDINGLEIKIKQVEGDLYELTNHPKL